MSTIRRRLSAAAAAVALAGGVGLATASPAQAYDLVSHYSAAEARQLSDGINTGVDLCGAFPWYVSLPCSLSGNAGLAGQIHNAADRGCGLDVYITATGSGMSYDKAEYDYALVC
jgi:hypothetical protein